MNKKTKKQAPLKYEKRLTLFVDILGFNELVEMSKDDPRVLCQITRAIEYIEMLGDKKPWAKTKKATQFSDCIIVSYRIDEQSAVFDMISEIGFMLVDQAALGVLVRGAIVVGLLIHTSKYIFGPAMNHAYQLENKVALYPRVIVSPDILEAAKRAHAPQHSGVKEAEYIKNYLRTDSDGQLFIDYVSWGAVVGSIGMEGEGYGKYLGTISIIVKNGLNHSYHGVQSKYLWLYNHYLSAIKQIEELPIHHDWAIKNPEMHTYILQLPKFEKEAQSALDNILKAAAKLN